MWVGRMTTTLTTTPLTLTLIRGWTITTPHIRVTITTTRRATTTQHRRVVMDRDRITTTVILLVVVVVIMQ